jgi:hypothetical protein
MQPGSESSGTSQGSGLEKVTPKVSRQVKIES